MIAFQANTVFLLQQHPKALLLSARNCCIRWQRRRTICSPRFQRLRSARSRCWQVWSLGRVCVQVCKRPVFLCSQERGREGTSWPCFYRSDKHPTQETSGRKSPFDSYFQNDLGTWLSGERQGGRPVTSHNRPGSRLDPSPGVTSKCLSW